MNKRQAKKYRKKRGEKISLMVDTFHLQIANEVDLESTGKYMQHINRLATKYSEIS